MIRSAAQRCRGETRVDSIPSTLLTPPAPLLLANSAMGRVLLKVGLRG